MKQMKSYACILLDWDGNLARTLDVWHAALKVPLEKRGHSFAGREIGANFAVFQERMEALGLDGIEAMLAEAAETAAREYPNAPLYPGVYVVLEKLHLLGKKIALVTTSKHEQIDPLLIQHGISKFFDAVVCGDDVNSHKPSAEPIEKALQLLGGTKESAVMIGDSASDIGAAQNANVDSILFFPADHMKFYDLDSLKKLHPSYVVDNFTSIIDVVS